MKTIPVAATAAATLIAMAVPPALAQVSSLPPVKISAANKMPECATPGRMMVFLAGRNARLDPRFAGIATSYMRHGEELGIRWDYAFFQMMLETGNLAFKRGDGKPGDVKPTQNNFAGLGATGGGVPGETFASVEEGVKAHLQHLLMYTGEHVAEPVADRTRKVQEWRVLASWQKGFKRPITFADIAGKWAPGSRGYVGSVKSIGGDFYDDHCDKPDPKPELVQEARKGRGDAQRIARAPQPPAQPSQKAETSPGMDLARRAIERAREEGDTTRSALGAKGLAAASPSVKVINEPVTETATPAPPAAEMKPVVQTAAASTAAKAPPAASRGSAAVAAAVPPKAPPAAAPLPEVGQSTAKCRVWTASYGGQKAVIIRSSGDQFTNFTVLDVNEGQEGREVEAYISAYAKGGHKIGDFASSTNALDKAFELCPEG
jgi:hypothetical protein